MWNPITLLIATGIRRSELLALRWSDFDEKNNILTVVGKVIRVPGEGLLRVDETMSAAGPLRSSWGFALVICENFFTGIKLQRPYYEPGINPFTSPSTT